MVGGMVRAVHGYCCRYIPFHPSVYYIDCRLSVEGKRGWAAYLGGSSIAGSRGSRSTLSGSLLDAQSTKKSGLLLSLGTDHHGPAAHVPVGAGGGSRGVGEVERGGKSKEGLSRPGGEPSAETNLERQIRMENVDVGMKRVI